MKTTKKLLSALMATALVFGSVASVSAAGTTNTGEFTAPTDADNVASTKGDGSLEGYADKEIFRVVVPTNSLNFIVDPQGLIKGSYNAESGAVANTKYKAASTKWNFKDTDDAEDERVDGFVFFSHQVQEANGTSTVTKTEYTNHLDLVVENKGAVNIKVTPVIEYTDGKITTTATSTDEAMGLVRKDGFSFGDDDTEKYVAFKLAKGGANASATNLANVDDCYKVTFASNTYKYELDNTKYAELTSTDHKVTYTLSAISNPNASGWTTVLDNINGKAATGTKKTAPEVKVVWTLEKATE